MEEKEKKKPVTTDMVVTAKSKMKSLTNASFDEIYNVDKEEYNEALKFDKKKNSKKMQLMAKYNHVSNQIEMAKEDYVKSLTNPTTDSVELALTIECLQKELDLTIQIHNNLFKDSPLS